MRNMPLKEANLKGLSHEIFRPVFWPVWMRLGLDVNRLWFYNFYEAPSIFGSYFKFWCASYQTSFFYSVFQPTKIHPPVS